MPFDLLRLAHCFTVYFSIIRTYVVLKFIIIITYLSQIIVNYCYPSEKKRNRRKCLRFC